VVEGNNRTIPSSSISSSPRLGKNNVLSACCRDGNTATKSFSRCRSTSILQDSSHQFCEWRAQDVQQQIERRQRQDEIPINLLEHNQKQEVNRKLQKQSLYLFCSPAMHEYGRQRYQSNFPISSRGMSSMSPKLKDEIVNSSINKPETSSTIDHDTIKETVSKKANAGGGGDVAVGLNGSSKNNRIRMKKDPIVVTDRAALRILELLSSDNAVAMSAIGLKLGVKRRGCNGLSYTLNYATATNIHNNNPKNKAKHDLHVPVFIHDTKKTTTNNDSATDDQTSPPTTVTKDATQMNVNVYIEPMALFNVVGTVMDYEENDMGSEFTFNNPNSKGSCGCGESFNV
jgi:iron-sulfur cluster assembly 1